MGLDCWVYQTNITADEINEFNYSNNSDEEDVTDFNTLVDEQEIWYGRKTHAIMDYLLRHYTGDNNVTYIDLDLDLEDLKIKFQHEVIVPTDFDEYELGCFKELIDNIESSYNPDKQLVFYAWY